MVRHPVAGGVVDGVARGAPDAHQLGLRPGPLADGTDVLVAGAVDLGGHHDQVAPPRPHHVEHPPVGHVRLEHRAPAERRRAVASPSTRAASPSVRTRSGAKVSRASRAPMAGAVPKALAITSPSPRNTSAQATAQYSARVTPVSAVSVRRLLGGSLAGRPPGSRPGSRPRRRRGTAPRKRPTPRGRPAAATYSLWNASSRP